jgi:hypothetical protein
MSLRQPLCGPGRYTPSGKNGYLVALKRLAAGALPLEDYVAYLKQLGVLRRLRNK